MSDAKIHLRHDAITWCGAAYEPANVGTFTFVPEQCNCGDCLIAAYEFGDRAKRRWKKLGLTR